MRIAHFAFDFRLGHKRGHGIDDDDVQRAGADEHVGDLEGLLAGVRLGNDEGVGVDAEFLCVLGVQGVLRVDECCDAAVFLGIRHGVKGNRRFARRLRAVDFDDPSPRKASHAQCNVKRRGPCGNHLNLRLDVVAQTHDRSFAELPVDLRQGHIQGLGAVLAFSCHLHSFVSSGWTEQVFVAAIPRRAAVWDYAMSDLRHKSGLLSKPVDK